MGANQVSSELIKCFVCCRRKTECDFNANFGRPPRMLANAQCINLFQTLSKKKNNPNWIKL